jgi:hypothetical protein
MQQVQQLLEALQEHPLVLAAGPLSGPLPGVKAKLATTHMTEAIDLVAIHRDEGRRLVLIVPRIAPASAVPNTAAMRKLLHVGETHMSKPTVFEGVLSLHLEIQLSGEATLAAEVARAIEELRIDLVLFAQRMAASKQNA